MSGGWQAKDRAKCVDVSDIRLRRGCPGHIGGRYLRKGAVYIVQAVVDVGMGEPCLDLGLRTGPKMARRFVKLPPDSESMAAERARPREPEPA